MNRIDEEVTEIQAAFRKKLESLPNDKARVAYCQKRIKAIQDWQKAYWEKFNQIIENIKKGGPVETIVAKIDEKDTFVQPKTVKMFVYGSLRKPLHNWTRWGFDKLKSIPATITGYTLYLFSGVSYPYLEKSNNGEQVIGEIYEVPFDTAMRIDSMEKGAGYHDEILPNGCKVYCRSYPGRNGKIIVQDGDWVKYVKENLQEYWKEYCKPFDKTPPSYYNIRDSKGRFCKKCFVIHSSEKKTE